MGPSSAGVGILELQASGDGILKIGRKLGIGTSVVQRVSNKGRCLSMMLADTGAGGRPDYSLHT
jgi:hypothetical protein